MRENKAEEVSWFALADVSECVWLEVVSVCIDVVHVGLFDHGLPCLSSYTHKHTMPLAAALLFVSFVS